MIEACARSELLLQREIDSKWSWEHVLLWHISWFSNIASKYVRVLVSNILNELSLASRTYNGGCWSLNWNKAKFKVTLTAWHGVFQKTNTKQNNAFSVSTREKGRFQCTPGPHSWNTGIVQVNLRPKKLKNHFSKVFLKVSCVFEFVLCLKIVFDFIPQVLTADSTDFPCLTPS